eukprot:13598893-Alexandrium_andersonii.AAC.1
MSASLVGSEMCIRDSASPERSRGHRWLGATGPERMAARGSARGRTSNSVSYTHLTLPTICSV